MRAWTMLCCGILVALPMLAGAGDGEKDKGKGGDKKDGLDIDAQIVQTFARIVKTDAEKHTVTVKAGSKSIDIEVPDDTSVLEHRRVKLSDLPAGTPLHVFGRLQQWDETRFIIDMSQALVAGEFAPPPHAKASLRKMGWFGGALSWNVNKTEAYMDGHILNVGRDAPLVQIAPGTAAAVRSLAKGRTVFLMGVGHQGDLGNGFIPLQVTITADGFSAAFYDYVLKRRMDDPRDKKK